MRRDLERPAQEERKREFRRKLERLAQEERKRRTEEREISPTREYRALPQAVVSEQVLPVDDNNNNHQLRELPQVILPPSAHLPVIARKG